jgi:hypothetical protein
MTGIKIGTIAADHRAPMSSEVIIEVKLPISSPSNNERSA